MSNVMNARASAAAAGLNCNIPVELCHYAGHMGPAINGEIQHVSCRDILLEVTYPLAAKSLMRMQVDHDDREEPFWLPVYVEQVARLSQTRWELRCRFTRELRDDDFAEVLNCLFGTT